MDRIGEKREEKRTGMERTGEGRYQGRRREEEE